jgi:hypothetical protein
LTVEAEDLAQVAFEIPYVITDASHTELAEVGEVLPDLCGVEMELLGQRLRRHRARALHLEFAEAAEVHGEAVRRQF